MLAGKLNSVLDTFKTKYPALIGVDISSTAIKLVELVQAGKGAYRLERYAIEPLVRDVVTDGNIANLDLVADPATNFVVIVKDGRVFKNTTK